MERQISAGDTVESQCTRCKRVLNHTIVAMVRGEVVRVKCNTCGSEHNHRPAKASRPPRAAAVGSSAAKAPRVKVQGPSDEEIWEQLVTPLDPDQAVPYRMDGKFRANVLLSHPSFGIGLIAAVAAGKIEVVFRSGRKLLRCA